jgi:hypothetical protein
LGTGIPRGLALDTSSVYWTADNGGLNKVDKNGGVTVRLVPSATGRGLVVDASRVYWLEEILISHFPNALYVVPASGGPRSTLAMFPDHSRPFEITQDDSDLYWTTVDGIFTLPKSGGQYRVLYSSPGCGIASDATNLYWTDCANPNGTVAIASKQGGPLIWSTSNETGPAGIAIDATSVYWANQIDGTIRKVPLAGGSPATIQSGQMNPTAVAVDDDWVYWANTGGNTIMKGSKNGGSAEIVATADFPSHVAVDAQAIYWAAGAQGIPPVVAKIAK